MYRKPLAAAVALLMIAGCAKQLSAPMEEKGGESLRRAVLSSQKLEAHDVVGAAPTSFVGVEMEWQQQHNTESYDHIEENAFLAVARNPLSTFSIDVDTASYANVRRFLNDGQLPPAGAVRIEELINYFSYDYTDVAADGAPFGVEMEVGEAPWNRRHLLARIGIKGREIPQDERPAANLVFLLDVSGSMQPPNKLPLLKRAMRMLTETLNGGDRVSIVVYAGAAGLVLPPTYADDRQAILDAFDRLEAGGSTAGGAGIQLAYQQARESFIPDGVNRVILATDGDFNIGVTDQSELVRLIQREAESGVFLTVLGFGMGNYKDSTLEQLADKGNGNYAYIDGPAEARKVLVEQVGSTLVTIAKDVKLQIEFNPSRVQAYRLIGYENRLLRDEDFNDDRKDAGEIGAGHTVTALYELVPVGEEIDLPDVDPLKYQHDPEFSEASADAELFALKIRYKEPDGETSRLLTFAAQDAVTLLGGTSDDFRFASAVALFGMKLRDSEFARDCDWSLVSDLAVGALGTDPNGYRAEFLTLVANAENAQTHKIASAP